MNELKMYLLLQNHRWFSSHVFWRVKPPLEVELQVYSWKVIDSPKNHLFSEGAMINFTGVFHGFIGSQLRKSYVRLCWILGEFSPVRSRKIQTQKHLPNHSDGKAAVIHDTRTRYDSERMTFETFENINSQVCQGFNIKSKSPRATQLS